MTVGGPCAVEGLVCNPTYTCGDLPAIARCVCTAGTFLCSDIEDAALDGPSTTPSCPSARVDAEACPPSEAAASFAACTEPGLLCSYLAACDATLDSCYCAEGLFPSGRMGLRFECTSACTDQGTPSDAAVSDDASSTMDGPPDQTSGTLDGGVPDGSD
jgi:hypothetical protein